jgi:endonuclease-8
MPEGDTIYRAARALQKALGGKVVTAFETGVAKLASVNDDAPVVGRVVERVEARGKWCLVFFSGDLILTTHMLMSGSWHIYKTGEKWRLPRRAMRVMIRVGGTAKFPTDHAMMPRDEGATPGESADPTHAMKPHEWGIHEAEGSVGYEAVLFNAQVAEFHTARSLERSSQVPRLGPDVLSEGFTVERGVAAMREYGATHPEAEIAVVLLNQRVLAGLGNVYKSEVAFAAGVNPFRQMRTLTAREMEKMVEVAQRYMKANVADGTGEGIVTYAGNRRTTRSMSAGDRLWVYGRQGQECRRCGATVMMRKQGAAVRSTYWCPGCQPWVAGEGSEVAPVGKMVGGGR